MGLILGGFTGAFCGRGFNTALLWYSAREFLLFFRMESSVVIVSHASQDFASGDGSGRTFLAESEAQVSVSFPSALLDSVRRSDCILGYPLPIMVLEKAVFHSIG